MNRPSEGALGPYLRAIRSHRLLVAVVTLVAIAASIAWTTLRPPSYQATANILLTPLAQEDTQFQGLNAVREAGDPTRTSQTAATLIRSTAAATRTAAKLGGDWSPKKVLDATTVTPEGESNILAVTGKADDADEAARLANTFARESLAARSDIIAKQATAEVARLRASQDDLGDDTQAKADVIQRINALEKVRVDGDPTLTLSQAATKPESPSGPPMPVIIILAALAGFTLGSGAALLLELTERRIRNEDETVALYPLPVLARIPLLKSSQLRGRQASGWHMLPAVREAFRTLMIQLGPHPEGRAHVVMVTSASTGDGKTTSAVNLAAAAAASGDPVILLDFDLRKPDVGRTLGVQPGTELTGLLQPDTQLRDLLSPAPGLPALSVLTTTVAEGDVALVEALSRRLPELIADARDLCNYVVIDTAPIGEISDALRLVSDVDSIIVVTKPGNTNRANFEMMRDLLERTAYTPAGFLVIGDSTPRTSAYYAYGATGRELFLQDPTPGGEPTRPRPAPTKSASEIVSDGAAERRPSSDREAGRRPDRVVPRAIERESSGPRSERESAPSRNERDKPGTTDQGPKRPADDAKRPADEVKRPSDEVKRPADGQKVSNNGEGDSPRPAAETGPRPAPTEGPHRRPTRPPRSDERSARGNKPSRSEDRPSKN
jgi:Mrp family chromosome partitioning ATPase